jgi:hypothetical protein
MGRRAAVAWLAAAWLASARVASADPGPRPLDPEAPSALTFGIRLGVGGSDLAGLQRTHAVDPDGELPAGSVTSSGPRIAMAVGGIAVRWFGSLGLEGEALLTRRGASIELVGDDVPDVTGALDLTYLDLDVLARFQSARTGAIRPYALFGPALSIELDSATSVAGEVTRPFDVAPFDVALVAGVGIGFGPERRGFTAEVRVAAGLTDVSDEAMEDMVVRNRTLLALAGFEL